MGISIFRLRDFCKKYQEGLTETAKLSCRSGTEQEQVQITLEFLIEYNKRVLNVIDAIVRLKVGYPDRNTNQRSKLLPLYRTPDFENGLDSSFTFDLYFQLADVINRSYLEDDKTFLHSRKSFWRPYALLGAITLMLSFTLSLMSLPDALDDPSHYWQTALLACAVLPSLISVSFFGEAYWTLSAIEVSSKALVEFSQQVEYTSSKFNKTVSIKKIEECFKKKYHRLGVDEPESLSDTVFNHFPSAQMPG